MKRVKQIQVSGHPEPLNISNRLQHLIVLTKIITVFETFGSESAAVAISIT